MSFTPILESTEPADPLQARLARKTAGDLVLYFPTVLVQGTIGLITAALLTKLFLPEHFGNYSLAIAVYSQLVLVTGGWLSQSILRLTPEYRLRNQFERLVFSLLVSEMVLVTAVSSLAFLVLVLGRSLLDPQLFHLLIVALIGAFFAPVVSAVEEYLRIADRTVRYSLLVLSKLLLSLVLGFLIAVVWDFGIVGFFVGYILPSVGIVALFSIAKGRRLITILRTSSFSSAILKDSLAYSTPLVVMNAMASILALADRYFIGWYQGPYEVAMYSVSYLIANQGMIFTILLLTRAADPVATRTWEEEGPAAASGYLNQLFRYYGLMAIPALFGLVILGRDLVSLLSTPDYLSGAPIVGVVGLGVLFSGYSQIYNRVFGLGKRTLIPLSTFALAATVNVVLNIILIPRFGFIAAGWTTLMSYMVLLILNSLMAHRFMDLRPWGAYLFKALFASLIMSAIVLWSRSMISGLTARVILSAAIGVFSYAGILFVMDRDGGSLIRGLLHRFRRLLMRFP